MPSLSWRPRPFGIGRPGRPCPVEGGAHVVAIVGLEHHVVQGLRQVERCVGESQRVVPFVAVVEADLEHHAAAEVHLEPVGLLAARARRRRTGATRRRPWWRTRRDRTRRRRCGSPPASAPTRMAWQSARPVTISTRTPHGAVVETSRSTRRAAHAAASPRSVRRQRLERRAAQLVEHRVVDRLEADERCVVRRRRARRTIGAPCRRHAR